MITIADEIFTSTMSWFQHNYSTFCFYNERDVVWTIQRYATKLIEDSQIKLKVFNDYPMTFQDKRVWADLIFIDENNVITLAVEFKYEPSHKRKDILSSKFPVVSWGEVCKDIDRINYFVRNGEAKTSYFILIDEGGYFRKKPPGERSNWLDFHVEIGNRYPLSLLLSKAVLDENLKHGG